MDNTLLDLSFIKKSFTPDEAIKSIKDKIDTEFDEMNVGEKISINSGDHKAYYLPSIKTAFDFLGIKLDLVSIIEKCEIEGIKPLQISRSSMYDLQGKGVGKNIYRKYLNWAFDNFTPYFTKSFSDTPSLLHSIDTVPSNASDWKLFWLGTTSSIKGVDFASLMPEFVPLIEFIEYRCDTELALQQSIRNRDDFDTLKHADVAIWWPQFIKPFFDEHTVLTSKELDTVNNVVSGRFTPSELVETEKHAFYIDLLRVKYDFILSAIAHYEVGYVLASCPDDQQPQTVAPLACHAIKKYATSNESRTCFDWTLQTLKDWWSETKSSISWRDIASCIPIENTDPTCKSGVTHIDKQYSRLKDWRKGKNLPSNKLLEQFITNIAASIGAEPECDRLFILCRITIGLDKALTNLVKEWGKGIGSESQVNAIWKDVLSHYYEDYYLHYLNQHVARKTQIEKI
ncbi:hypothetical protein MOVI109754_08520 [Moritella viscosa]|uniref:Orphan protein n=1 Tax=Moritella viscosa TaxID=80854 RepID=A0ABY1H8F9_9GAMM|nr:Putative orphan protein [Moritella viscosa]SGZ18990.1 Putative orphan protein [Moritella viscosa]SHO28491.1 Putative orphan protein [Moritella viscosa]